MLLTIVMAVFTFNLLWAVYTTFSKEKIMIKQGEGALPASTYSFIVLRHVTRMVLYYITLNTFVGSTTEPVGTFKLFVGVIILAMILELISAVIETLVRIIYFRIIFSKKQE